MTGRHLTRLLMLIAVGGAAVFGLRAWPAPSPPVGGLLVEAPAGLGAGEPLRMTIRGSAADGTPVRVVVRSAYGTAIAAGEFVDGSAVIQAPHGVTNHSGRLDLLIHAGAEFASHTVAVHPGPVIEPPTPLIGARSIVAGDTDRSMAVVIPGDAYGNPVVGADVAVTTQWPDGHVEVTAPGSATTLRWQWIASRRTAGRARVFVTADGIPGIERHLRVVPGPVAEVAFGIEEQVLRADGASLATLSTTRVVDGYGNVVPDGTAVQVSTRTAGDRYSFQTATTVGGVARTTISLPGEAGGLEVVVTAGPASATQTIDLAPGLAVALPDVAVERLAGVDHVLVGPVLGASGQLVPDGTAVGVVTDGPAGAVAAEGYTLAGHAVVTVEVGTADDVTIVIGGRAFRVPVGGAA